MDYNKLEYYCSAPRLNKFLTACGNSKGKAEILYQLNVKVSQTFYPILNLFEIFLRNALNHKVAAFFANPDWIISEKNGFMNDSSLGRTGFFLKAAVQKAENTIWRKGGLISSGKVIAEQSLGFWTSLFDVHHYRLLGGSVIQAFQHKPAPVNRRALSLKLTSIREFRNRIYHNEPICFLGNSIDFAHTRQIRRDIYEVLAWMDGDLASYVTYFDVVDSGIDEASEI